jgi:hypothetical protein
MRAPNLTLGVLLLIILGPLTLLICAAGFGMYWKHRYTESKRRRKKYEPPSVKPPKPVPE